MFRRNRQRARAPRTPALLVLVFAIGLSMSTLDATIAAPPAQPARTPDAQAAPASTTTAKARPRIAVTDWIAADALRLLAGNDVDIILVPGLNLASPARRTVAPAPSRQHPGTRVAPPRDGAERVVTPGTEPARPGASAPTPEPMPLAEESRKAIDAAEALLSTDESRELHAAAKDLCAHHASLASAIRPQLRVARADNAIEPAFWMDAGLWARTVLVARQTLTKAAPEHEERFKSRAQEARDRLLVLNDEMLASYGALPTNATLIVGAEGFGQLTRVHTLDVRVVPAGLNTKEEQEALREIVELILARKIPVVFPVDAMPNPTLDELVARVKARGGNVRIGATLHLDTPIPGDDGSAGAVERMLRHNARAVREGFTAKGLPSAR